MNQTVVFDFDGVVHSYISGWKGKNVVSDPPVDGFEIALKEIYSAGYKIAIVSSRCDTVDGRTAIWNWLKEYEMDKYVDVVCAEKPPAVVYIDDRAICFDGHPETLLDQIKNFHPWYKKER